VATFEAVGGTASSFKVGDISVGDEDFAWWKLDYVATVDPYGSQDTYYAWDPDTLAWYECDAGCNILDPSTDANDVEFEANLGLLFCTQNGVSLNIPSPL
jgi:hypothetical protein